MLTLLLLSMVAVAAASPAPALESSHAPLQVALTRTRADASLAKRDGAPQLYVASKRDHADHRLPGLSFSSTFGLNLTIGCVFL